MATDLYNIPPQENEEGNSDIFSPGKGKRPSRLNLPFTRKADDPGTWSYDHRVGICITVIAYLVFGIIFVSARISLHRTTGDGVILVDFPEQERPERDLQELERLQRLMQAQDFADVRNLASNENAELNPQLRDDRGTQASDIYNDAAGLDDRMRANREAYEAGLRQQEEMLNSGRESGEQSAREDVKVQGRVTVSFSFTDPRRNSVNLIVPAYRCEGGGEVVLDVTLDINGRVTSASVIKDSSSSDYCMQESALEAARGSRFNADRAAPQRHRGTISYIFIPQ